MFCKKCGAMMDDNAAFCPVCGEAAQVGEPIIMTAPVAPAVNPILVMVMGIISLATCDFGILGIIFGAIACGKANAYTRSGAPMVTQVRLGRIFGKIGLILGIVMTVCWVIIFTVALIAGILASL